MTRPATLCALALASVALDPGAAFAREVSVQMKDVGAAGLMVFEPAFVRADVGDTVRFVPTDPAHNAQTIDGMLPAGVAPAAGGMGKPLVLTLSRPGLYGIKCGPHFSLGMVALIQAGSGPSPNLSAARSASLPPLAAKRMAPLLAQAR